jgi:hypothetical protein
MAPVSGTFGDQQVNLENAATEATLQKLLVAITATSKEAADAVAKMAKNAGLDPEKVKLTTASLTELEKSAAILGGAYAGLEYASDQLKAKLTAAAGLVGTFTSGTGKASDLFGALGKLPGPLGLVGTGFQLVSQFQEQLLKSYQEISASGVNFSGSLIQMRVAASSMYLSMDQFSTLVKKNSESFINLGGGVDKGFQTFSRLSNNLINSQLGDRLLSLGYSFEEINQGLASYIGMSGPRRAIDLADEKTKAAILTSSSEYLENLNALSEITGKSRDKQQEELDAASKNAAFQAKLATMSEDERKKALAGMANALAIGGKGAVDAFQSKLMGIAPDKAGALFLATASNAARVVEDSVDMVYNTSIGVKQMASTTLREGLKAAGLDFQKFSNQTLYAIIRQGGPLADSLQQLGITANKASTMTEEQIQQIIDKADADSNAAAEAREAAENQKEIMKMGQELLKDLMPIFRDLKPLIPGFLRSVTDMIGLINKIPGGLTTLLEAIVAFSIGSNVLKGASAVKSLINAGGAAAAIGKEVPVLTEAVTAGKVATSAATGTGLLAKGSAKLGGKMLSKFIPGIGLLAGGADAYMRLGEGDYFGAGLAAAGGLASLIPGVGGIVAAGFDVANLARDLHKKSDDNKKEEKSKKDDASILDNKDDDINKELITELKRLNTISENMLHTMQLVSNDMKRSVSAINGLNKNLYPVS